MLNVVEVFESVQGEGFHTGRPAIFIRFAGCNLHCDFCDTKYSWPTNQKEMTPSDLVGMILDAKWQSGYVILTGGEPLIQNQSDLHELIWKLRELDFEVGLETNGTQLIDREALPFDWVTVSPKSILMSKLVRGDELKLLYDGTQDTHHFEQYDFDHFYLQPILPEKDLIHTESSVGEFMRLCHQAVVKCVVAAKQNPLWHVSFQCHKILGIR